MSNPVVSNPGVLGLCGLVLTIATPVWAADLAYPYPPAEPGPSRIYREERVEEVLPPSPPPYREPRFVAGPRFAPPPGEECHTIVKRRVDVDGDEVERRVRICEDAPYARPRAHYRPSFYDPGPPLPPAEVPFERYEGPPRW